RHARSSRSGCRRPSWQPWRCWRGGRRPGLPAGRRAPLPRGRGRARRLGGRGRRPARAAGLRPPRPSPPSSRAGAPSSARAGRGARWLAVAVAGPALGGLAKGPIALVLPGLAAGGLAVLDREGTRRLRPVAVLGLAAALAGLWYVVAFQREGEQLLAIVGREN